MIISKEDFTESAIKRGVWDEILKEAQYETHKIIPLGSDIDVEIVKARAVNEHHLNSLQTTTPGKPGVMK